VDGIKTVIGNDTVTVREGDGLSAKFSEAKDREVIVRVKKALVEKYAEGPWENAKNMLMRLFKATTSNSLRKVSEEFSRTR
jgi:hypothetical protein